MAKVLRVSPSAHPFQVDGFPKTAERSVEGALHFTPGGTKTVTDDEWIYVQLAHKHLLPFFQVLPADH